MSAAALSSSGSYLAFGDADGNHHVWSSTDPLAEAEDSLTFNGFGGVLPEYADEVFPPAKVDWTAETPLNSVGMPYYDTPLLSNLPNEAYCPPGSSPFFNPPTVDIPLAVLSGARQVDFVGYAQTPRELKGTRNRVASSAKSRAGKGAKQRRVSEPRFRSEREKDARWGKEKEGGKETALESTAEDEDGKGMNKYRKVEIKYSKFGETFSLFSIPRVVWSH